MATTRCPACGLSVPYFCCEGLVCPACGYDEEQNIMPRDDAATGSTPQVFSQQPLPTDAGAPQPPVQ
jgi:uncharacterized Zn finger protein (UPF0148 family)